MTYLFKLASRISQLRLVLPVLVMSAVACSKGEKVDFLAPNPGSDVPKLTMVRIDPKVSSAQVGSPIKFTATGYSATGSPMPVTIDWVAQGGSISATGEYIGQTSGQFTVVARSREDASLADSASVGVWSTPIDAVAVIISPDSAVIEEGDSLDFTAAVALANGVVTGDAEVNWSADGGMILPSGKFTVTQSGVYTVSAATLSGLRGWAKVFVRAKLRTLMTLTLSPKSPTVQPGSTTDFSAMGHYGDGTSSEAANIQWSATGGSITSNGAYTAGNHGGNFRVIAHNAQADVADTSSLVISAPTAVGMSISPKSVTLAPTATQSFSGLALMSDGSSTSVPVTWTATGGSVSASGTYTAGSTGGTYRVIATSAGVPGADTATISIVQPVATLTGIQLNPASVSLGAGQTRQFNISGVWSDGSTSAPPVSWTAAGGTITSGGFFTAGSAPGTYRVIAAAAGGIADTSQVTVLPAALTSLSISPTSASLVTGGNQQFTASGTWSDGSATAPSVTWTANGGTITGGGLYTSSSFAGTYRVIATQLGGTLADTSLVTVTQPAPVLSAIVLSPASVVLAQNGVQQFNASGLWSDGSSSNPAITWSATGGTVNSTGRYTAGTTAGTFRVIAKQASGSLADTSSVVITAPPAVTNLTITPGTTTKQVGSVTQFNVGALWSNGSTAVPAVTWTATGGTVSSTGLYTAGSTPGTFRVIVAEQAGTHKDTADVTLTAAPAPTLSTLSISPSPTTVAAGQTRQFTVAGSWSDGSSSAPAVTWSATGGSITTTGLYSAAATAGTFRVIAVQQGGTMADTSTVTVTASAPAPTLTAIVIAPATIALSTGENQFFAVTATWSDGATTVPALTWTSTGGTVNAGGFYTAGSVPGTFRVIAAGGGTADTAVITISGAAAPPPPTLTALSLTPDPVTVNTGTTRQFSVGATWSDGGTTVPAITWTATGGTINSSGLYTAGSTAGSSFRVIAAGGGKADTAAVTVAAGTATLTSLNVSPKPLTLITGATRQFTASATWSNGSTTVPALTWTATGGTINTSGLYAAGSTAGTFQVIAAGGGKADTSVVTLQAPTLTKITISPKTVSFAVLALQQFQVSATWSNGATTLPAVTWSATGGIVTGGGLFTAAAIPGVYRVIVAGGGKADTAAVTLSLLPPPPPAGSSGMFFNSSEAGCGSDSNLLLCDDFERGNWYSKNCDQANASGGLLQVAGWCGTIYGSTSNAPALCGGNGAGGTNCAANGGMHTGGQGGQNMASHEFSGGPVTELYARWYYKTDPGYKWGAEKNVNFTKAAGDITFFNIQFNCGAGSAVSTATPYIQMIHGTDTCQGPNVSSIDLQSGKWYYFEVHAKLNSSGTTPDGLIELWINDCGTNGVCSGSPTLRTRMTNVKFDRNQTGCTTSPCKIEVLWFENWANPGSTGTGYLDQIKVSKAGQVGFMP